MANSLHIVILAAGQGKRMFSDVPKVLHPLAGQPLLHHVLKTANKLNPDKIIVIYGHGGAAVRQSTPDPNLIWVEQALQLGTGHAVLQALPELPMSGKTLILYGDVPLLRASSLKTLVETATKGHLALLSAELEDPQGYGRIIRSEQGEVLQIVEQRDASPAQQKIREINTGVICLDNSFLHQWLPELKNDNAQGEYYLTDLVTCAVKANIPITSNLTPNPVEALGVNTKAQLATLERYYQYQQAEHWMNHGVTLADPARFDVRGELRCGRDVFVDVGCIFIGLVELGDGVRVGPYCILQDCSVGQHTELAAFSHLAGARIGPVNKIGPYARIRPGTVTEKEVHVGNFVEIKASQLGTASKANHLSYLGDASIGSQVNIGAGTITCNYDGAQKHRTVIGNQVFIGSDTQLIAPVTISDGATIAAGTTVWRDVPEKTLVLNRKEQNHRLDWSRPQKPGTKDSS